MSRVYRLELPRYDQAWQTRRKRKGGITHVRPVWDPLQGNTRAHWRRKNEATQQLIGDIMWLAKAAKVPHAQHLVVTLTWAPGDNRRRDADNLWPFLKACCDALARGPRADWPGLRLVPDDTPEFMDKRAPVIAGPPASGLWLDIEVRQ